MRQMIRLIFSLAIFFSFSTFCNAQDAMAQLEMPILKLEKQEKPSLSAEEVYLNHTGLATTQLINHLAVNVKYPDELKAYGVEGNVIVEVLITKDGEIKTAKVFQSLQTEFDQLVLTTIQEMKTLRLQNQKYQGARRLRIPVNFSFR